MPRRSKTPRPMYDRTSAFSQLLLWERLKVFAVASGLQPGQEVSKYIQERFIWSEVPKGLPPVPVYDQQRKIATQLRDDLKAAQLSMRSYRLSYSMPTSDRETAEHLYVPDAVLTRVVLIQEQGGTALWAKVGLVAK